MTIERNKTYVNPIWSHGFADPFVLKVRGRYFAYATDNETHPVPGSWVFPILTSIDLVTWHEVGKALPMLGPGYFSYWAPEVTVYNGKFYLYYAVHTEEFRGGIRVAVAERPEGPFVDSGHDLTSAHVPWAIDPHVYRDQDGQWYLYMTIEYLNDPTGLVGSGNAVARLRDPFTLEGELTRVTPPSQPWELFEAKRASKGGIDWYTVEGPTVFKHRNRYYEMFSGGCYYRDNYAISYATSDTPMGPHGMQDASWHDWQGDQILRGTDVLIGPGHNSIVIGPNNVEWYLAYHAWQQDMKERRPCLDRFYWEADGIWTPAPTHTPQPVPAMPTMRELFAGPELSSTWRVQGGTWTITDNAVMQTNETTSIAQLQYTDLLSNAWLLEINLCSLVDSGAYGVVFTREHAIDARIMLTPDRRIHWYVGTQTEPVQSVTLPPDTNLQAWHQLILSLSGSVLCVQFDQHPVMEGIIEAAPSSFALCTTACSASFSGITLTDHFCDEFLNDQYTAAQLGWQRENGMSNTGEPDWHIYDGALQQPCTEQGERMVVKDISLQAAVCGSYEIGVTMRLDQQGEPEGAAAGLVLWNDEHKKLGIWLCAEGVRRFLRVEGDAGQHALALPETFDLRDWHTIRLEQRDGQLMIALDGPQVLTHTMAIWPARVGVVTRNSAAAFRDISFTGSKEKQ